MTNGQANGGARKATRSSSGLSPRRLRILVVDDEESIVATMRIILRNFGHHVEVAYDGKQAVEAARRFRPDLLLSDVIMPGKDGVDAALEIRQMLPDCAVLLISGSAQVLDLLAKARAQWADFELMAKPVHPSELIRRIDHLCGIRHSPEAQAG